MIRFRVTYRKQYPGGSYHFDVVAIETAESLQDAVMQAEEWAKIQGWIVKSVEQLEEKRR